MKQAYLPVPLSAQFFNGPVTHFQDSAPFSLKITSSNVGGLIGTLMGLEIFVPKSHICRREGMDLEQVKATDNDSRHRI